MTHEHLNKIDTCRHLLEAPAPEVVGELVTELRRYMAALDAIYNHNEAARAAVIQHFGLWHAQAPNATSEGSPPSRIENKQERNGDSPH